MFERFTKGARNVVVLAQNESRGMKHNYIGTEHLLLGLLGEPQGLAAQALDRFGLSLADAREEVAALVGTGKNAMSGHIPFTPRAKKVLELGLREALQLNHNYIGTEHLLLGLIREGEGTGAKILKVHAPDLLTVRMAVLDLVPAGESGGSRRWLRGRRGAVTTEPAQRAESGEPEDVRITPATETTLDEAARLAGALPIGSHHLLLATLADADNAAARALATLGVDVERAREALRNADVTDTTDEQPEEAGRRRMTIRATQDRLTLEATDQQIVDLANAALKALGGQADTIRGDLPVSVSLGNVWQALHDSLQDIRRRADGTTTAPGAAGEPGSPAAN